MTAMDSSPIAGDLKTYFHRHQDRFRAELFEFLRVPSVSSREEHRDDVAGAAEWLADSLRSAGLASEVHAWRGHPIVLGEWRGAAAGSPTVLVYGHYDVQPPGPSELWQSPPFEPSVREGRVYARGATDDKGQLLLHVKALEAYLATRGELPVNVVVLAEGEEEIGSPHLASFVERHAERLRCSAVVISDSAMLAPGVPAVVATLRGIAAFEIEVFGPAAELHSGEYGGAVVNPAMALARILASVHDAEGRIVVPGFTDRCRDWPEALRREVADLPLPDESFREEAKVPALGGEAGYTTLERRWMRPTFEVHGLLGGYTDSGMKSIIPPSAMAKVSCRLVPDQDPDEIDRLVRAHVERVAPAGTRVEVRTLFRAPAWDAGSGEWLQAAAARATRATFGRPPVRVGGGGSIPVVTDFERVLGAPVLLLGFGLPGENAHAPNEHFSLENFELGMRTVAALWEALGEPMAQT
jgi:acetylornithine deacetylase/succinyl-diaminopimelate desuccinylase-like protein